MSALKDRLAEARTELGLSQAQLAKAVGAGQSTIASIENGRNKGSSLFLDLARALDVNVEWLMDGAGPKRGPADSKTTAARKTEAPWPFPDIPEDQVRALPPAQLSALQGALALAIAQMKLGIQVSSSPAAPQSPSAVPLRAHKPGGLVDMDHADDPFPMRIPGLPPAPWEGGKTANQIKRKGQGLRISQAIDVGHVEDSGYSANDHEFLPIPELDVRLAAGQLGIENYQETEIGQILLRRSFLESFKRPIDRMKIGYGDGHSMEPIIRHRNPMLMYIHPVQIHEIDPRFVYAINHGGKMIVKCLARDWDGTWLAKSINPAYEPFPLALDDGRDVRIIGTILWSPYDLRNGVDERLL